MQFEDYCWKEGKPVGLRKQDTHIPLPRSYNIATDPYHKRYTVEKYIEGVFEEVVYDSALFDFRRLKQMQSEPWERIVLSQTSRKEVVLLRDPDDRPIAREIFFFANQEQVRCEIWSVHNVLLCSHTLFSTLRGDTWNGLILKDRENKVVLWKEYALAQNLFSALLTECWNPQEKPPPSERKRIARNAKVADNRSKR